MNRLKAFFPYIIVSIGSAAATMIVLSLLFAAYKPKPAGAPKALSRAPHAEDVYEYNLEPEYYYDEQEIDEPLETIKPTVSNNEKPAKVKRKLPQKHIDDMFPMENVGNSYRKEQIRSEKPKKPTYPQISYNNRAWVYTGERINVQYIEAEATGIHQNGCEIYIIADSDESKIFLRRLDEDSNEYLIYAGRE